jgi:hypothetical protein
MLHLRKILKIQMHHSILHQTLALRKTPQHRVKQEMNGVPFMMSKTQQKSNDHHFQMLQTHI